jgi:hypothetical protein
MATGTRGKKNSSSIGYVVYQHPDSTWIDKGWTTYLQDIGV